MTFQRYLQKGRVFGLALFLAAMVGASEGLAQREIVFPEIAAILTGLLLAPKLPWRVTRFQMIAGIIVCALIGTAISMCPVPGGTEAAAPFLAFKLTLAYALAHLVLIALRTSFAPMISAAVLPVLLGARGPVYPVSAAILVCLCAAMLPRGRPEGPAPEGPCPRLLLTRLVCVAGVTALAACSGALFLAAPPLLVAYTQLSEARSKDRGSTPLTPLVIGVVTACAVIGLLARCLGIGSPAAFLASLGFASLFRLVRFAFPPAAAMTLLAFIIPETHVPWYPLEVFAGITLLTGLSYVRFSRR